MVARVNIPEAVKSAAALSLSEALTLARTMFPGLRVRTVSGLSRALKLGTFVVHQESKAVGGEALAFTRLYHREVRSLSPSLPLSLRSFLKVERKGDGKAGSFHLVPCKKVDTKIQGSFLRPFVFLTVPSPFVSLSIQEDKKGNKKEALSLRASFWQVQETTGQVLRTLRGMYERVRDDVGLRHSRTWNDREGIAPRIVSGARKFIASWTVEDILSEALLCTLDAFRAGRVPEDKLGAFLNQSAVNLFQARLSEGKRKSADAMEEGERALNMEYSTAHNSEGN